MNPSVVSPMPRRVRRKRRLIILVVGLAVLGIVLFIVYRAGADFEKKYVAYTALSEQYAVTAYTPAAENNAIRARVNRLLAEVLAPETSTAERLTRAQEGLQRLKEIEKQVDAIGSTGEQVSAAIASMEGSAGKLGNITSRGDMGEITRLARRQVEVVSDIRGLSYRANYHIGEIFQRVIDDKGVLSDAYVLSLNESLPEVEEQFDQRTNLYAELESTATQIRKTHAAL